MSLPALTLDEAAFLHNRDLMLAYARAAGVAIAPHAKTPMAPDLARSLIDGGAWGATVADARQAAVMLRSGVSRLILANEIGGTGGARRPGGAPGRLASGRASGLRQFGQRGRSAGLRLGREPGRAAAAACWPRSAPAGRAPGPKRDAARHRQGHRRGQGPARPCRARRPMRARRAGRRRRRPQPRSRACSSSGRSSCPGSARSPGPARPSSSPPAARSSSTGSWRR